MPDPHAAARKRRLALIDVDGTLTRVPSIWQFLMERMNCWWGAGEHNLARFQAGEVTYEEFCALDAKLLAGTGYHRLERVAAEVPLRPGIDDLFVGLRVRGYRIALISTGLHVLNAQLARRFDVDLSVANDLAADDRICTGEVIIDVHESGKGEHGRHAIEQFAAEHVLAIGDSVGDLPLFALADVSVTISPRTGDIARSADYCVDGEDLGTICGLL